MYEQLNTLVHWSTGYKATKRPRERRITGCNTTAWKTRNSYKKRVYNHYTFLQVQKSPLRNPVTFSSVFLGGKRERALQTDTITNGKTPTQSNNRYVYVVNSEIYVTCTICLVVDKTANFANTKDVVGRWSKNKKLFDVTLETVLVAHVSPAYN